MKSVMIEWIDSSSYDSQSNIETSFELFHWKSVGFLIKKLKDKVIICRDMVPDSDQVMGVLVVPKKNIIKMKVLK